VEEIQVCLRKLNSLTSKSVSLQKQNSHKVRVEAARGAANSRHERDRGRGTVTKL